MQEYIIERISPENLHYLNELYIDAFHTKADPSFFKKKFDTKNTGAKYIGFLALTYDRKPAAYYGVFPCIMHYEGGDLLVAQSGDTMTHSAHRGKGLFIKLAKETYALAREQSIRFVFGFPNQNSYPGFINKLSWTHTEDLEVYKIKVPTLPLAKVAKRFGFLGPVYRAYTSLFYKKADEGFQNSAIMEGCSGLRHDAAFYNYKSYYKHSLISIKGRKLCIRYDGRIWVGDIELSDAVTYRSILRSLKLKALFTGATEIVVHASKGTALQKAFADAGKCSSTLPVGYLKFDLDIRTERIKFCSFDLDTF